MSRRWHPPGTGWVRTIDYGDLAVWMRPEVDGVSIAAYSGDGFGHLDEVGLAETWIVRVGRTSLVPYEVMDKAHRLRWVVKNGADPEYGALSVERRQVRRSHRGHRRLNWRRGVWRWPLPRKIRRALEDVR